MKQTNYELQINNTHEHQNYAEKYTNHQNRYKGSLDVCDVVCTVFSDKYVLLYHVEHSGVYSRMYNI